MPEIPNHGMLISGRQVNPDGSVTDMVNGNIISSAPSQSDSQAQIAARYGLGELYKYAGGSYSQLTDWLSRSDVPEDRKQALIAQLNSLINSLPEHSGMDLLSEQIIGTSNYQKAMQKLSGELGSLISTSINANYEEKYNSAVAQSGRERQAGINTDLAGISSEAAGSATDNNEMAAAYQGLSEPIDAAQFANVGIQGIQMIIGFAGQVQGWISNDISNAVSEVALDNTVRDNIRNAFAGVVQDKDTLDLKAIQYVQDYYSNFGETGLDKLTTRADLENWITDYNKRNPNRKPLSIGDLYGSAILQAAKSNPNPFSGVRAKRAYDRAMRSISPSSPYVQSYIKSLEATEARASKEGLKDQLEIKALLSDFGKAFQDSFKIVQDAQNELNKYTKKFYQKRNGDVTVSDGEAETSESFVDLEFQAEAEQYDASKAASIASKYQQQLKGALRETFETRLEEIKKASGEDSWHYIIASIIYPALAEYLESRAIDQIASFVSRPAPANVTRYDYGARNTTINNN